MNSSEIVFDDKQGISIEEQKEIMAQINGMAEKNRKALSEGADEKTVIKAKKNSALFPIIFNVAAAVMLVGGSFTLIFLNGRTDAQVRTGGVTYDVTERALIELIRRETAEQIEEKENEITTIATRLSAVDEELLQLHSSNVELTAEQRAAQERLIAAQNAFREELSILYDERSQILEASRAREARLRAQLEERTREFAAAQERTTSELESAISKLDRLTSEQDRITAIDMQFSGGLAAIRGFIQNNQYDNAIAAIASLRQFLNNNTLASSRVFQSRRIFYSQSLDFVESLVTDARRLSGAGSATESLDLIARNAQLQNNIDELQKTIDALSSGGSGLAVRISELEETIAALRASNIALEQNIAEKENTISTLETENSVYATTATQLRATNTAQEQEIANLRNQITIIRQALQEN